MYIVTRNDGEENGWTAQVYSKGDVCRGDMYTGRTEAEALGNLMLGIRDSLSQMFKIMIIPEQEMSFMEPDEIPDLYTHW